MRKIILAASLLAAASISLAGGADSFDLQGHRGARGLAPENTLEGFTTALAIGVDTLELDLGVTKDDVVVVSHDSRLNPDHTRGPDGKFLTATGPAIRSLTLAELQQYDIGRLKPGTAYAANFATQKGIDGARIPPLAALFDLVQKAGARHVRFNIETKLTPSSGADTPEPEPFAAAVVEVVRKAGVGGRTSIQSFDWRTLAAVRRLAPELERVCLTIDGGAGDTLQRGKGGPSPWTAGLDIDDFGGSAPRLVDAAGCAVWSPMFQNLTPAALAEAKSHGIRVIPWTVNTPVQMKHLITLGVDGLITDYPDRARTVLAERQMPLPPQVLPAPSR